MPQNATQVVAGRDIIVYTAPFAASPANALPANTVAWGTTWGGSFVDSGYTRDGVRFRMSVQRQLINVDQVVDPVLRIPQQRDLQMQTRLAQITALNLANATGQGTVTTTANHEQYDISGVITDQYIAVGFDIRNPGDLLPIRILGYKGLVQADVEMAFNTNEAATIAFDVGLVPDTSSGTGSAARVAAFRDVNVAA